MLLLLPLPSPPPATQGSRVSVCMRAEKQNINQARTSLIHITTAMPGAATTPRLLVCAVV